MTHTDRPGPESELLAALTLLVADWASVATQETIARRAGVTVDAVDVQPLSTLGQLGPRGLPQSWVALGLPPHFGSV